MLKKKIDNYNAKQEKILKLQEEQEVRKKKEQEEIFTKLKEKNEKNLEKKKKNEQMIESRRKRILDKYVLTEARIQRKKEENDKELMNKHLEIAMKREDTIANLRRFEKLKEFERENKMQTIIKREKRLAEFKKQKTQINLQKIKLSKELSDRRQFLIGKANKILLSGDYSNVNEIFTKVFNKDEMELLKQNKEEENNRDNKSEEDKNENPGASAFFTTQIYCL